MNCWTNRLAATTTEMNKSLNSKYVRCQNRFNFVCVKWIINFIRWWWEASSMRSHHTSRLTARVDANHFILLLNFNYVLGFFCFPKKSIERQPLFRGKCQNTLDGIMLNWILLEDGKRHKQRWMHDESGGGINIITISNETYLELRTSQTRTHRMNEMKYSFYVRS